MSSELRELRWRITVELQCQELRWNYGELRCQFTKWNYGGNYGAVTVSYGVSYGASLLNALNRVTELRCQFTKCP